MSLDRNYELLDFEFSEGKKRLKVVLTYFGGVPKVDIREYYLDKEDGEFKHTKKGVQLDPVKAEALRTALERNAELIDRHLLNSDLETWAGKIKKIETSSDFFSAFEFFKCASDGSFETITFNLNHPLGKRLGELEQDCRENATAHEILLILKTVLIAHEHSLSQFDENAKLRLGDFLQDQTHIWSTILKRLLTTAK
jgi:hypothetical protein